MEKPKPHGPVRMSPFERKVNEISQLAMDGKHHPGAESFLTWLPARRGESGRNLYERLKDGMPTRKARVAFWMETNGRVLETEAESINRWLESRGSKHRVTAKELALMRMWD